MRTVLIIIICMICLGLKAQTNKQYLGVRGGVSYGISSKIFNGEFKALEGLLSFRSGGVQLTALIETYKPVYLKHTDRVYFYSGLGAHLGYTGWRENRFLESNIFRSDFSSRKYSPVLGLDGMLGLEYRFEQVPLVLALDYKPFFDLFGQNFFNIHLWDFGFAIRYVFN